MAQEQQSIGNNMLDDIRKRRQQLSEKTFSRDDNSLLSSIQKRRDQLKPAGVGGAVTAITQPGVVTQTKKIETATPDPIEESGAANFAIDTLFNIPKSIWNVTSGLVEAVKHPIETAGVVGDIATGGVVSGLRSMEKAAREITGTQQDLTKLNVETQQKIGAFTGFMDILDKRFGLSQTAEHSLKRMEYANRMVQQIKAGETVTPLPDELRALASPEARNKILTTLRDDPFGFMLDIMGVTQPIKTAKFLAKPVTGIPGAVRKTKGSLEIKADTVARLFDDVVDDMTDPNKAQAYDTYVKNNILETTSEKAVRSMEKVMEREFALMRKDTKGNNTPMPSENLFDGINDLQLKSKGGVMRIEDILEQARRGDGLALDYTSKLSKDLNTFAAIIDSVKGLRPKRRESVIGIPVISKAKEGRTIRRLRSIEEKADTDIPNTIINKMLALVEETKGLSVEKNVALKQKMVNTLNLFDDATGVGTGPIFERIYGNILQNFKASGGKGLRLYARGQSTHGMLNALKYTTKRKAIVKDGNPVLTEFDNVKAQRMPTGKFLAIKKSIGGKHLAAISAMVSALAGVGFSSVFYVMVIGSVLFGFSPQLKIAISRALRRGINKANTPISAAILRKARGKKSATVADEIQDAIQKNATEADVALINKKMQDQGFVEQMNAELNKTGIDLKDLQPTTKPSTIKPEVTKTHKKVVFKKKSAQPVLKVEAKKIDKIKETVINKIDKKNKSVSAEVKKLREEKVDATKKRRSQITDEIGVLNSEISLGNKTKTKIGSAVRVSKLDLPEAAGKGKGSISALLKRLKKEIEGF